MRRIAALGLAAAAFTLTAGTGIAGAATLSSPAATRSESVARAADVPAANAFKVKIKSVVEMDTVRLTGIGRNSGWAYKDDFTYKHILAPTLAEEIVGHWSNTYKRQSGRWHFIMVNGIGHRSDNGQAWKTYPALTPKQLVTEAYYANPMHVPPLMFKLKVARHVGKGHWRAVGSLAQLAPFINNELNLSTTDFKQHGYTRLTIDLWLDSKGRPTKVTATGTARYEKASLIETFSNYDKPLSIVPPKA